MAETAIETDAPAVAAPTPAEQILAMLPDHTHARKELTGATVWTWTTPDGTWGVTLTGGTGGGWLKFSGPGGDWSFGRVSDSAVRQLHGVLLALGAISESERRNLGDCCRLIHVAVNGCSACSAELGEPHRYVECSGNRAAQDEADR